MLILASFLDLQATNKYKNVSSYKWNNLDHQDLGPQKFFILSRKNQPYQNFLYFFFKKKQSHKNFLYFPNKKLNSYTFLKNLTSRVRLEETIITLTKCRILPLKKTHFAFIEWTDNWNPILDIYNKSLFFHIF